MSSSSPKLACTIQQSMPYDIQSGGCRDDAEDVVDLMRACLLDKFADKASMLDIPRAGGRGKQVCTLACNTNLFGSDQEGMPL